MNLTVDKEEILTNLEIIINKEKNNDFFNVINNDWEKVMDIDDSPVTSYHNSIIDEEYFNLLIPTYKAIKYYMNKKNEYPSALQEGMALFISKAIILEKIDPNKVDVYFNTGDRSLERKATNPFEEVARLLLITAKRNFTEYNSKEDISLKKVDFEHNSQLEIMNIALSATKLSKRTWLYYDSNIVKNIFNRINMLSYKNYPASFAFSNSNKSSIEEILNMIALLHENKVDRYRYIYKENNVLLIENLEMQFNNSLEYAKRNIGFGSKTKVKDLN